MEENNDGTNTELTVDGVDASLGESWTAVNLPPETGPSATELIGMMDIVREVRERHGIEPPVPNRYSGGASQSGAIH